MLDGQEMIIARGGRLLRIQAVFADPGLSRSIAWAATLGADWMLALSTGTDKFAAQKLVAALEAAGCTCEHGKVDSKLSGRRLRERATDLLEAEVVR